MTAFTEFESRLRAAFPDDFGQRFESVAKWFLETDPRFASQLARVWLWDEWPGRWGPDVGSEPIQRQGNQKLGPPDKMIRRRYERTSSRLFFGFRHLF